jgi:hypothetical protein
MNDVAKVRKTGQYGALASDFYTKSDIFRTNQIRKVPVVLHRAVI